MAKKKKQSFQHDPAPSAPTPVSAANKPLWGVELDTSPEGRMTIKVRALTESDAMNLAVAAAYKRDDVRHVLDVGRPKRLVGSRQSG